MDSDWGAPVIFREDFEDPALRGHAWFALIAHACRATLDPLAVVLVGVFTFAIASTAEPAPEQSANDGSGQLAAHAPPLAPEVYDLIDQELRRRDAEGPVLVNSYYGRYSTRDKKPGHPAPSLEGPIVEPWLGAQRPPPGTRLAVLLPHVKDPFWVSVNLGIISEARRLGIGIDLYQAGGYHRLGTQVRQLEQAVRKGNIDGVIIGQVEYRTKHLGEIYEDLERWGVPIVPVCIDTYHPAIDAKAVVPWYEMGFAAGGFLAEHSADRKIKVAMMPGPEGLGWVDETFRGFIEALEKHGAMDRIEIIGPIFGDTGDGLQRFRLGLLFRKHTNIDYLVGNALAAVATLSTNADGRPPELEGWKGRHPNLKVISTYLIPDVHELIRKGKILAAPNDNPKQQGVMAVDMIASILNGKRPGNRTDGTAFRSGPVVQLITSANIEQWSYETLFGPRKFVPVYQLPPGGEAKTMPAAHDPVSAN